MTRLSILKALVPAALLIVSCAPKEQNKDVPQMSFKAAQEYGLDTKTSLDGTKVLWSASDKISVFSSTCKNGETYSINSDDAGKGEATFTGNAVGAAPWYALYPADERASMDNLSLSMNLPARQIYAADGFADGSNPAVAVSSTEKLSFKNLCGILSLQLTGSATITSIELVSAAQEALWGAGTVDMSWTDAPVLVLSSTADEEHRKLTLDCGEGVTLSQTPTVFNLIVPAGTLGSGFTVIVHDSMGGEMAKVTQNSDLVAVRSHVKRLSAVEYAPTDSDFLSVELPGIFDLSGAEPKEILVAEPGVQFAFRDPENGMGYFRMQSLESGYALIVEYPSPIEVGSSSTLKVSSLGITPSLDASVQVTLLKNDDGFLYFQDFDNKRGYLVIELD
ncbi:MAG: hypothetical protein J5640_08630 [Bacteroidales bacterium]|nr:hypothetical protein [Bacteroidales bacterium]